MKLLLAAVLAAGGCSIPDQYVCHTSPQCGSGGTCLAGTCAFPDDMCPTGLRLLGADCVAFVPPHLGTTTIGSGDLVLTSGTIDTKTPSLSVAGVTVTLEPQTTGPEMVVVHAHTVTVPANAVVDVIGTRPIVFVALSIDIQGTLDVGGHASSPGAGSPSTGPGTGGMGTHANMFTDSGGGGGGFGTAGAAGGDAGCSGCATAVGGSGGQTSGDALMGPLVPGFAGGDDTTGGGCGTARGGAGGGAVQLSAVASITIAGNVLAGGGGGDAGTIGNGSCNFSAGGGGGSGGMIVIQAPDIAITGVVAANGGAGGSGASSNPNTAGKPGADGGASATPAVGGAAVGSNNIPGGNGAAGTIAATTGGSSTTQATDNYNGGGGGGGTGRIALIGSAATTGATISPTPVTDRRR